MSMICEKCKKETIDYRTEYIRPEKIGGKVLKIYVGNDCCPKVPEKTYIQKIKEKKAFIEKIASSYDATKVVFLDIDGVANSEESLRKSSGGIVGIDKYMAFLIGKIQLETNCVFVLSSAWKHSEENIAEIEQHIAQIYDITPTLQYSKDEKYERGKEIQAWLNKHPNVKKYAILDDDSDMLPEQLSNFFKTSWKTGITEEIMKKVITHLS